MPFPKGSTALSRFTVLDLTRVRSGPTCVRQLGDWGANVIKIETPPHLEKGEGPGGPRNGPDFQNLHRNKRSITLDLKDPGDIAVLHRLVETADVLTENFRPGVAARLSADYETLRAINPRLIFASISGFGQTGPYAQRAGYDLIAQGLSGVMSITGEPGGDPVKCGVPVGDLSAGLFCAVGILSALAARARTGRGQQVDTSLFEGALAFSVWETAELWATGNVPEKLGSAHRLTAPYQALRTRDGHLTVGANTQRLWERLCAAIGREDLLADERFALNPDRMANRAELQAELEETLGVRGTDEWVAALEQAGVPAGPIHDYAEVFADPHTQAREMEVEMEHPEEGTVRGLGIPVKLSETPGSVRRAAPLLGQHSAEVLREAGFTEAEIEALA
jgi:formyl-CoA transferase